MDADTKARVQTLLDEVEAQWPHCVRMSQSQRPPDAPQGQALSSAYRIPFHEVERRLDEVIRLLTGEEAEPRKEVDPNRKVYFERISGKRLKAAAAFAAAKKSRKRK